MKLHLPKLLRVAVLAAMAFTYVAPAEAADVELKKKTLLTGNYEKNGNLELSGTDRMGYKDGNGWVAITNDGAYTGAVVTQHVVITGSLTLSGNSRVDVGGIVKPWLGDPYYTGITADSIDVSESAELYAYKVNARALTVSGGNVEIHYDKGGNAASLDHGSSGNSDTESAGYKQTHIKESLTVSGGSVKLGSHQSDHSMYAGTSHILTVFGHQSTTGGSIIAQEGGTLDIQGKTATVGDFTIDQTGGTMNVVTKSVADNPGDPANGPRLLLASNSTNSIRQSGSAKGMTMTMGRIQGFGSDSKVCLHIQQESQYGKINLTKGVSFASDSVNSSITLTGGGSVNLTGDYSGAVFDVNLKKGLLSLTDSSTKLKSNTVTLASGAALDNNGIFTVGSGTAGSAGVLNVTNEGTLNLVLNGTASALSVGAASTSTNTVTGWTMATGSKLGVGFTKEALGNMTTTEGSAGTKVFTYSDILVASVATGSSVDVNSFGCSYVLGSLADLDTSRWTLGSTSLTLSENVVMSGSLVYNPYVEIVEGGDENRNFGTVDEELGLYTGLRISQKDVTLNGNNSHTLGTEINGVTVTLGHENALGTGEVKTTGKAALKTADGVTANLPGAIAIEDGTLSVSGQYKADASKLAGGKTQNEAWFDVNGNEGNGFHRAGTKEAYEVVKGVANGNLSVNALDDVMVTIGGTEYQLYSDGLAGNKLDYSTYYLKTDAGDVTAKAIHGAGSADTTVNMVAGKLNVNEDIAVDATGGEIAVQSGKEVTGSIKINAVVIGDNGTVGADLKGGVTLKGSLALTGDATGTLALDDAAVTLGATADLVDATLSTAGTSSLSTAEGVTASIGATIQNSGQLTLNGSYDASGMTVTELAATNVNVDGGLGANGFARDAGSTVQLVKKLNDKAALELGADFAVGIDGVAGTLDTASGVVTTGAAIHYDTYYIKDTEHSVEVGQIQVASGNQTDKVVMSAGSLKVNEDIAVEATGGEIAVQSGKEVTGSIKINAVVIGDNGTVGADLKGGVTLKGSLALTGDATGTLALDDAAVTLGATADLVDATLSTAGTSSLSTTEGVTASIGATIQNSGQLTLKGSYDATGPGVTQLDATHVNVDGGLGTNGFVRDAGSTVQLVKNLNAQAALELGTDFAVGIDGVAGTLDTASGVVTTGAAIHYGTYFIADAEHSVEVGQIQVASGNQTDKVVMSAGSLNVNEDIAVVVTGGAIAVQPGKTVVAGTIEKAKVSGTTGEADAGVVAATLKDSTLKGKLTVTGAASGKLELDDADVTLTSNVSDTLTLAAVAAPMLVDDTNTPAQNTSKVTLTGDVTGTLNITDTDTTLTGDVTDTGTLNISGADATLAGSTVKGTLNLIGADVTLATGTELAKNAVVTTSGTSSLSTDVAEGSAVKLGTVIQNTGVLTLSGSYDVEGLDSDKISAGYVDIDGSVTENGNGFERDSGCTVEVVKNENDGTLDGDAALWTIGTRNDGVLDEATGVVTFGGGINYATYHLVDSAVVSDPLTVSAIKAASGQKTTTVVMSNGSLTADEDIEVQTTGGNLIVVDDGDDDKTDGGAVVSGTIKDTAVSAQGGTIKATIEGGTLTTETGSLVSGNVSGATITANGGMISGTVSGGTLDVSGDALVSGDVTKSEITVNGGEISGAIEESTIIANSGTISGAIEGGSLDVSGDALVNGTVTGTEITAKGGEISGAVSGGTLDVSGAAQVSGTVTGTEITAEGGEISGAVSGGTLDVSGDAKVSGAVTGSEITANGGTISGDITGGSLAMQEDALVSGSVTDTAITTKGGEISGTIGGTSSLTAMSGMTTLSGSGNSYSGGTVVQNGATLVVTENGGLGTGDVVVESGATLDMQTDGNAQIEGNLVVNENGTITLNDGSLLEVNGSVTLNSGATIILNGEYDLNAPLVSSSTGTLTMNDVTLVYNDTTMEVALQDGQLVLVPKFKQEMANAATASNWGIATASRAVVNAVRGQRSNTGCIANGKGTAWMASLGSKHEISGSDIDISGAAVGADMKVGRNSRIGIALGYAEGEVQPAGFSQVDQEGSYLVVYGEHGLKKLSPTSSLSMDWVAAYGMTDSEVGGLKWEQDSLQLNSRVNWNKKVNNRLCMSVFGGLEYFANNSDTVDGMKTGSIQNLRGEIGVGARYVAWGTPDMTRHAKGCEKLVLNGEVRYMNDMVRSNPVFRMNNASGMGQNPGRQGIGIEAGATYRIGERWSASANYGFNTMEDSKEHRVNVGASYTF